jgi:transposase
MKTIREILRLKLDCHLSARQIADTTGYARNTVGDYLSRFKASGLPWPLPAEIYEIQLESLLFQACNKGPQTPTLIRPEPDWAAVHSELRRKGVTLMLLWQEYRLAQPDGYQYSWFCQSYRDWCGKLDLVMRQHHVAGEKLFVDFSGTTLPVIDRGTGEIRQAEIFVAVMGVSNSTFVMVLESQKVEDWSWPT